MASAIELRAPFLDHCLVEFCCRLPRRLRVKGLSTKAILREAMKGKVPHEIIKRGKKGFPTPIGRWFRRELQDWVADIIFSKKCSERGLFRRERLKKIFDDHMHGAHDNTKALWTVINLELWYEAFIDTAQVKDWEGSLV
jgi:asparagine synthase (glutamine-hydrolysing)